MEVSRPDQSQEARPNAAYKRREAHQFHSSEGIPLYCKQLEEEELEIDTQVFTLLASTTTTVHCSSSTTTHPAREKNQLLQRQQRCQHIVERVNSVPI